jgi:hypothetical protein
LIKPDVNLVDQLNKKPIIDGILIERLNISSGSNQIEHKLGRIPRGYIIVASTAAVNVYNGSMGEYLIPLVSDASATISLWVF